MTKCIFENVLYLMMSHNLLKELCADYGGIENPSGGTCCPVDCGTCGGSGCSQRPGGATDCCVGNIPEEQVCGDLGQTAPCRLGNKYPQSI